MLNLKICSPRLMGPSLLLYFALLSCETPSQIDVGQIVPLSKGSHGLSTESILDPKSCQPCHPLHYAEWRASVHASAADSPAFLAINRLGQEETDGSLGAFCVQCHAPVAVALGETTDGLNLTDLPARSRGITCAYCHQIEHVNGTYNNPLQWSQDGVMRGGIERPQSNSAHQSQYHILLDGQKNESSRLCGACHDIVIPSGIHLERTYQEWSESIFASDESIQSSSCGSCHMPSRRARTNSELESFSRSVSGEDYHDHLMPAVDLVYTSKHDQALKELTGRTLRDEVQRELDLTLLSELCAELGVSGGADVEVYLENVSAGHRFPSGAALDRRLWVELSAYSREGEQLFTSGELSETEPAAYKAKDDPLMWLLRDSAFDPKGIETHKFWEINTVDRSTLPPSRPIRSSSINDEEPHVLRRYRFGTAKAIYEIRMKVLLRPIALEFLYDLRDLGLLDQDFIRAQPTYELTSATLIWRADEAIPSVTLSGRELLCTQ